MRTLFFPLALALAICPLPGLADDDQAAEPPAIAAEEKAAEPAADERAQIVLMIGQREPITLAAGPWHTVQLLAAQVALAADALQWRELRARMLPRQPSPTPKEPAP